LFDFLKVNNLMNKTSTSGVHYLSVSADYADQRIDNFLVTRLKGVPKTRIYRILRKGEVRVNKKRVQPSYRLQAGDEIRIPPIRTDAPKAKPQPSQSLAEVLANRILYEDKSLLIINKPSGIAVHGGSGVKLGLVEALRCIYPKLTQLELAHRLDAETSGCLIFAKKRGVLKELHDLMRQGLVKKVYFTLTKGHWKQHELRVEVPLQKNQLSGGERIVKVQKDGKPSLTIFKPVHRYEKAMLVEATLKTGRTHQIRVHSQYQGHPIAGDEKYGDREFNKYMKEKGLKRLFLHAHYIEFTLPSTGEKIIASAPLDEDLEACLQELE
jgi:23S rRNA pseudouridine955/2504/2580 synthase